MDELAVVSIGRTFNQYAEGPRGELLRERLVGYLEDRADAPVLLVGEAPGYRGARVSGIPFTSERQLTGSGPAEATATIVHRVLAELELEDDVLLWNVVPTHPGTATSNRRPTRDEIDGERLRSSASSRAAAASSQSAAIAHSALGGVYVRHPSHGGAECFRSGLRSACDGDLRRAKRRPPLPRRPSPDLLHLMRPPPTDVPRRSD